MSPADEPIIATRARAAVDSENLTAALDYARRSWSVFPLHCIWTGRCSCGHIDCTSPGKHPQTPHGYKDATTDEATIRSWWARWTDANVGIATGAPSDIVVLDVDPRHQGDETLRELERTRGALPETVQVLTGGGGVHYYFRHPHFEVKNKVGIAPGLDVRGDGGYVAAPRSSHRDGRCYEWEGAHHPDDLELAPIPDWLLELMTDKRRNGTGSAAATDAILVEGQRNDALFRMAGAMRRPGMVAEEILPTLLAVNARRCQPPLPDAEVHEIATGVMRYEPAAPYTNGAEHGPHRRRVAPAGEFPEQPGEAAYAGIAGRIVDAIDSHTEADRIATLTTLLLSFGTLVGLGPHTVVGATRHFARDNAVLVGPTAKARKGDSFAGVHALLKEADPEWADGRILSGLSSGEGLIAAVRDPVEKQVPVKVKGRIVDHQTEIVDPGEPDKRLYVVEPEFGRTLKVMGRQGNTLSPIVRQAWDSGDLRVMTKTAATATGAHISILGHITVEELQRELADTEAVNGFANRILWVLVRRSKLLPNPTPFEGEEFEFLADDLRNALRRARAVARMERDAEANALWCDIYGDLSKERPGLAGAILARAEAHVLRLSMLYALLDGQAIVTQEHLLSALELWGYCERSVEYVFGDASGNPVADAILRALRVQGELTRSQISDHLGRHQSAGQIAHALQLLLEHGKATATMRDTGGRPAEVWQAV